MNLLLSSSTEVNVLILISIVVAILIGAAAVFAFVAKAIVAVRYLKYKHKKIENNLTAEQMAVGLTDALGLNDVKVVRCNFFSALWFGNSYGVYSKKIRLRKNIYNSASITACALATQKVAQAVMHKEGNKKLIFRSKMQPLVMFAPIMFVPIIIVGAVVDLLAKTNGTGALVGLIAAGIYYLIAFLVELFTISVEKKANKKALDILATSGLVSQEELDSINVIYKTYILSYIADFILTLLYIIKFILQVIIKILANQKG